MDPPLWPYDGHGRIAAPRNRSAGIADYLKTAYEPWDSYSHLPVAWSVTLHRYASIPSLFVVSANSDALHGSLDHDLVADIENQVAAVESSEQTAIEINLSVSSVN